LRGTRSVWAHITANQPTAEFLAEWCPRVPVTRPLQGNEALLSNRKAREVLGFEQRHNWRDEVKRLASTAPPAPARQ